MGCKRSWVQIPLARPSKTIRHHSNGFLFAHPSATRYALFMSWKQTLAWPLHRVRETLGLFSYTQPQTHELTYSVIISAQDARPITFAIPLPLQTNTQEVRDLVLHLPHTTEERDTTFNNRVLIATIEPRAEKMEVPIFHCLVTTSPNRGQREKDAQTSPALTNNRFIHTADPRIQTLARHLNTGSSTKEKARRINNHLTKHLVYGDPIDGLYSDTEALIRPNVDCGGFVTLFTSLCLANNIPARIASGFWIDGEKNDMHAWAEFQDEQGRWIPVDPSVEQMARQGRTHKSGRFSFVGSDRLTLSIGCDIPIPWNNKIQNAPILQHPFILEGSSDAECRAIIRLTPVTTV